MSPEDLARVASIREYTALGLLALLIIVGAVAILYFAKIIIMAHVKSQADQIAAQKTGFESLGSMIVGVGKNVDDTRHALANGISGSPAMVIDAVEESEKRVIAAVERAEENQLTAYREHELIRDRDRRGS